jgi:hypothetical protein
MEVDALAGGDQSAKIVEGRLEALGHVIGAAIGNRGTDQLDAGAGACIAQFEGIEAVEVEVVVILEVMNRCDTAIHF